MSNIEKIADAHALSNEEFEKNTSKKIKRYLVT